MIKYTVIGVFFGLLLSFILPFVFAIFASALAGSLAFSLSGTWLYYAAAIPFVLTFSILGSFFWKKGWLENKNMWLLSAVVGLFIPLYCGTIGALYGEYIVRQSFRFYTANGYLGTNVKEIFIRGTIYAFILLPVTVPLARLLVELFWDILQRVPGCYKTGLEDKGVEDEWRR